MAWQPDDAVRSIRRYLSMTLASPPWTLRVERREVKNEERPVGVVTDGPLVPLRSRSTLIQGQVEEGLPITISLYPEVVDPKAKADAFRETRLEASKLKAQLSELINTGLTVTTEPKKGETRHWAGPFRIPLWDYEGVPVTGKEKAGPEDPHDVLWVDERSLSVQAIQDPEDPGRWSVIANFRVTIERPGRVPPPDEIADVKALEGHFEGEPA